MQIIIVSFACIALFFACAAIIQTIIDKFRKEK